MQSDIDASEIKLITEYSGVLTHSMILFIGDAAKEALTESHNKGVAKTVFFCINEMMQNVSHYSAEVADADAKEAGVGFIALYAFAGQILIRTQNRTAASSAQRIEKRVSRLNNMTREELKKEYKGALAQPFRADKKGAGLGLIEILRKSGGRLSVEYTTAEEGFVNLRLELTIPTGP